jgi:hypothetical protein
MHGAVWDGIVELVDTVAGFAVVMGIWVGIQAWIRKRRGCSSDRDMLDFMLSGCGGCPNQATCSKKKGL